MMMAIMMMAMMVMMVMIATIMMMTMIIMVAMMMIVVMILMTMVVAVSYWCIFMIDNCYNLDINHKKSHFLESRISIVGQRIYLSGAQIFERNWFF